MDQPEKVWLAEYRQGHTEALGKLVEHYRRPLFSFILKMTEGRSDADEVFQEVWFRVIKNIDSYKEKSFLSWLFRIAHNLIIDRVRRLKPMVDVEAMYDGEGTALDTQFPAEGLIPSSEVAGKDIGQRIAVAVDKLPLEQREVFLMRMEADISFKEIAEIQGISINTALARMQYALNKLRTDLQGDYNSLGRGPS